MIVKDLALTQQLLLSLLPEWASVRCSTSEVVTQVERWQRAGEAGLAKRLRKGSRPEAPENFSTVRQSVGAAQPLLTRCPCVGVSQPHLCAFWAGGTNQGACSSKERAAAQNKILDLETQLSRTKTELSQLRRSRRCESVWGWGGGSRQEGHGLS